VRDLIAGRVQFMFATLPSVSSLIKGGQLKAIAISSKKRYVTLPEVPTLAENGIPIITGSWFGVFAPKNTPPEILKKLNENIVDIVMSKKTNEKLINEGAEPIAMNLAEFSKFVKTEYETWAPIVRASGAKPE
jgi:tripartite-type tricarboxylate transporter receptor subunit TctC